MKLIRRIMILVFLTLALAARVTAQRPDAPPYALPGPYTVGTQEFAIESDTMPLHGTVWYPALNPDGLPLTVAYTEKLAIVNGHALRDADLDLSGVPYPLIVYSHGLGGFRFQSAYYLEHLTSYGFIVMAVEHPGSTIIDAVGQTMSAESIIASTGTRPLEVLAQIDFAERLNGPGGILEGMIDMDRIGVTGHSFGGYTAIASAGARLNLDDMTWECSPEKSREEVDRWSEICPEEFAQILAEARGLNAAPEGFWPATADPRIKAVVAQAPAYASLFSNGGLEALTIPAMIQVGTLDETTSLESNAAPIFDNIASQEKYLLQFQNAGHFIYVEECTSQMISFGYYERCSDKVWDMARAHDLTNHFATAFFLHILYADAQAAQALVFDAAEFPGILFDSGQQP